MVSQVHASNYWVPVTGFRVKQKGVTSSSTNAHTKHPPFRPRHPGILLHNSAVLRHSLVEVVNTQLTHKQHVLVPYNSRQLSPCFFLSWSKVQIQMTISFITLQTLGVLSIWIISYDCYHPFFFSSFLSSFSSHIHNALSLSPTHLLFHFLPCFSWKPHLTLSIPTHFTLSYSCTPVWDPFAHR